MSYEIVGESIKSAISIKLGQIFGSSTIRYKEEVTKMQYPNFFINQLSLNITPSGKTRITLDYFMNIRYRYAEDIKLVSNLQQQLDDIGKKLCTELTTIQLERPVKISNCTYEKNTDGVLQFFCNIKVFAKPSEASTVKMQELDINEEV